MKLQKIALFSLLSTLTISSAIAGDKYCGCSDGGTSYSWTVPDGKSCSSASGKAVKSIILDEEIQLSVVDVSEAVHFC